MLSSLNIYRIFTNSIINKLIKLSINNKLKGDNSSFNTKYTYYIINNRKLSSNAFNLKHLLILLNYTASKHNI
jgi:hypothetical protein